MVRSQGRLVRLQGNGSINVPGNYPVHKPTRPAAILQPYLHQMNTGGVVASKPVTRAEHERLKREHARLMADVRALRETMQELRADLRTQFTRIAEMQAILDEQRMGEG